MDKETLFKAIRNQEVVLWAGAGFSKYAGYPLGGGVVRHLMDGLSKQMQQKLRDYLGCLDSEGYPAVGLPDFAEAFVELHNGQQHQLRRELSRIFSARPKNLITHKILTQLPFIEHIITTNYDSLFEQAYGQDQIHVVTEGSQLPYQEPEKITLYKIHGDLDRLNKIVITSEDYRHFLTKSDRLLWGVIEGLLATKTVLFVGYGLADSNVLSMFEQLLDALGTNMRSAFLVAPDLGELAISRLRRRNIVYINTTGEQLIEEVFADAKMNVIPELRQGKGSLDKVAKFINNLGFNARFKMEKGGYEAEGLHRSDGPTTGRVSFKVDGDETFLNSLDNFRNGAGLAFKISKGQLVDFVWKIEELNLGIEVVEMWMFRSPSIRKKVDVEFVGGLMLSDVEASFFATDNLRRLVAITSHAKLTVDIPVECLTNEGAMYHIKLSRRHNYFDSIHTGMTHAKIMKAIGAGEEFSCFAEGRQVWHSEQRKGTEYSNELSTEGENLYKLMSDLSSIEKAFGIRFRRFVITEEELYVINTLAQHIKMQEHYIVWNDFVKVNALGVIDETFTDILLGNGNKYICILEQKQSSNYRLMGWELSLNFVTQNFIFDPKLKPVRKKGVYQLSSATKSVLVKYIGEQEATVVSEGVPLPEQVFSVIDILNDIENELGE